MLKEQGNILEEQIEITGDLLNYMLENGYTLSLKNGDYSNKPIPQNRKSFKKSLIERIHALYIGGSFFPFVMHNVVNLMRSNDVRAIFKRFGLRILSDEEFRKLYANDLIKHGKASVAKMEASNLSKYGVKTSLHSDSAKVKARKTNLSKYGDETFVRSDYFKRKRAESLEAKFGPNYRGELAAMAKDSFFKKTGIREPFAHPEISRKARETLRAKNLVKYGVPSLLCFCEFQRKMLESRKGKWDEDGLLFVSGDHRYAKTQEILKFTEFFGVDEIMEHFGTYSYTQALKYLKRVGLKSGASWTSELKILRILDRIAPQIPFVRNAKSAHGIRYRDALYDCDFYFPEMRIGIEVNGLAFHSTNFAAKGSPKQPTYHFEKFCKFWENGIKLLSFTDYEVDNFESDVEGIIKFHLKISEDYEVSREFLEFNEISNIKESLNYGMFDHFDPALEYDVYRNRREILVGKNLFEYEDCGKVAG